MNVYQKKLEDANVPQFTSIHNAANVQMETGTTIMNKVYIENINDDLNTLLLSYLRQLEQTREEYQRASEKMEDFQERCYEFELKQKVTQNFYNLTVQHFRVYLNNLECSAYF